MLATLVHRRSRRPAPPNSHRPRVHVTSPALRAQPPVPSTQIQPRAVTASAFDGFALANGGVAEARARELTSEYDEDDERGGTPRRGAVTPVVHQRESLTLDAAGTGAPSCAISASDRRATFCELEFAIRPARCDGRHAIPCGRRRGRRREAESTMVFAAT